MLLQYDVLSVNFALLSLNRYLCPLRSHTNFPMTTDYPDINDTGEHFPDGIRELLQSNGIRYREETVPAGVMFLAAPYGTGTDYGGAVIHILAVPVYALNVQEAQLQSELIDSFLKDSHGTITVAEDMWRRAGTMMRSRILAHLGIFRKIYARDCRIMKISKDVADNFLAGRHSYGKASYRHCYGMFLDRERPGYGLQKGDLAAVACFSNARRWKKDGSTVTSYEWVRYASCPDMRIPGGMSKMLRHFISGIHPDDIMSYADLEWSEGDTYRRLGFIQEERRPAVTFAVDTLTWERIPLAKAGDRNINTRYFINRGSIKYRLKPEGRTSGK